MATQKKKPTRKEKFELQKAQTRVQPAEMKAKGKRGGIKWAPALIVAAVAFALYANTLSNGYALDDFLVIKENRLTKKGWSAFPDVLNKSVFYGYITNQDDHLYRPLPKASFAIEWALAPDNPRLAHFTNIVLYAFTGLLLFVTFRKYLQGDAIVPFIASLLFIAHPIHTEAVANIKSRDEIMSLLFALGAMNMIYEWIRTERFGWMLGAVMLFFLSLLSKESGITFLAVFPLAVYFFTDTPSRKNIVIVMWMLVPLVIFLIIRHHVLAATAKTNISELDNVLASAPNGMVKLATAIFILGLYLKVMFFPHPLVIDYSYKQIPLIDMSDWRFVFSLVIYAALVLVAILGLKKRHFVSFAILYFLITISIVSNILVLIGTSFGERLMLIPSVGFCLVLAFFGAKAFPSATKDFASIGELFRANSKLIAVCSALVVLYGFKTIQRNKDWKDNYTLFSHDVKIATQSAHMHKYYGDVLSGPEQFEGRDSAVVASTLETAIVELKKAIEIFPKYAECYNRLGLIYYKKKMYKEALDNYNLAIQYNNSNAVFYNNIGTLFFETHDYESAMKALRRAVELDPHNTDALSNLASIYGTLKDYDSALVYLQRCITEDPNFARAYYFLSITYGFKGDKENHDLYMSKYREMTRKNTL